MAKKPQTVYDRVISGNMLIMQALIGAKMALETGNSIKELLDVIAPILEKAQNDLQGACNLLNGYGAGDE